jgi:hypothetical protein
MKHQVTQLGAAAGKFLDATCSIIRTKGSHHEGRARG